jgi:hypothetical protein
MDSEVVSITFLPLALAVGGAGSLKVGCVMMYPHQRRF